MDPSGLSGDGRPTTSSGGDDDNGRPPGGGTTRGGRGWFCPSGGSGLQCGGVVGATGEGTVPPADSGDSPEGAEPGEDPDTAEAETETDAGKGTRSYEGKDPDQPGCANCNTIIPGTPGALEDEGGPPEPVTRADYENDTLDEGTPPEDDVVENPEEGSQQPVDDDGRPGGGSHLTGFGTGGGDGVVAVDSSFRQIDVPERRELANSIDTVTVGLPKLRKRLHRYLENNEILVGSLGARQGETRLS